MVKPHVRICRDEVRRVARLAGFYERATGVSASQFRALSKYLDGTRTPAQVHRAVSAEVNRAAQFINTGLRSFPSVTRDTGNRRDAPTTRSGPALSGESVLVPPRCRPGLAPTGPACCPLEGPARR